MYSAILNQYRNIIPYIWWNDIIEQPVWYPADYVFRDRFTAAVPAEYYWEYFSELLSALQLHAVLSQPHRTSIRSNQASRSTKCRFRGLSGTRTVRVMDFNSPIEGSGLISKCVISCGGRKQVASRHCTFWANNLKPFCCACCWLTVVVCPLLINVCVLCEQWRHSLYLPWTELNTSQAQQFCGQHSFSLQSQMELSQKRLSWRRDHAATAQVRTCVALGMCPRRGQ